MDEGLEGLDLERALAASGQREVAGNEGIHRRELTLGGVQPDQVDHRGAVLRIEVEHALERLPRLVGGAAPHVVVVEEHLAELEPGLHVVGPPTEDRAVQAVRGLRVPATERNRRLEQRAIALGQAIGQA